MIINFFRVVFAAVIGVFNIPITIDTFTFSLWQVFLAAWLVFLVVMFVRGLFE